MATYQPLQSTVLTSATSSVTFSNIPPDYTDLVVVVNGSQNANQFTAIRFNNDTASNYSQSRLMGTGSVGDFDRQTSVTFGRYGAGNITNNSVGIINIMNYSNTTTYKTWISRSSIPNDMVSTVNGLWRSFNAINSVTLLTTTSDTWNAGSTFDLYGISSGSVKAFGGNLITTDNNYWYHVFTSSGSFVTTRSLTCDVLSVGGGGGGGWNNAGGGGGGEVDILTGLSIASGVTKTVTIGGGGATATSTAGPGGNGVTTSFASHTTSLGGGGGGTGDASAPNQAGQTGGSGGGGALSSGGGSASGSNTNVGGAGYASGSGGGQYAGGGGGGATSAGSSANLGTLTSGAGGQGYALANIFSGLTLSGITHFGSGGSGGVYNGTRALGGTNAGNGAQDGGSNINPTTPTANAGGGGGGGAYVNVNSRQGSNGGSGIVIVRYPV